MGATASTPANLVVGAGDVLIDTASKGVTRGDNVYRVTQELFAPDDLNGVPGVLIGTHYKTKEEAVLECGWPEVAADTLAVSWPGSQSATVGSVTTIDSDGTSRRIPVSDYHDYDLRVPGLTKTFDFLADNALNLGTIEFNGQNKDAMTPKIEAHSTWDAASLSTSPHRITVTAGASS